MGSCCLKNFEQNEIQDSHDKNSFVAIDNIKETSFIKPMVEGQLKLFPEQNEQHHLLPKNLFLEEINPRQLENDPNQTKTVLDILQILDSTPEQTIKHHHHHHRHHYQRSRRSQLKKVSMEDLEKIF